jgi:hypothetical protein
MNEGDSRRALFLSVFLSTEHAVVPSTLGESSRHY